MADNDVTLTSDEALFSFYRGWRDSFLAGMLNLAGPTVRASLAAAEGFPRGRLTVEVEAYDAASDCVSFRPIDFDSLFSLRPDIGARVVLWRHGRVDGSVVFAAVAPDG